MQRCPGIEMLVKFLSIWELMRSAEMDILKPHKP